MDTITQNYNNCPMLCPFTVSNFAHLFCTLLHDLTNISGVYNTTDNIRDVTFKLMSARYRITFVQRIFDITPKKEVTESQIWAPCWPMSVHILPNCVCSKLIVQKVSHSSSDMWPCSILHKYPAARFLVRIVERKFWEIWIEFRFQHIQVPSPIHCQKSSHFTRRSKDPEFQQSSWRTRLSL